MTRGGYVFERYSDRADLRGAGRGCGSYDSTENMGAWNKGRASYRNGFFYSGLHLCGNRSFWPDHNFRVSSAIPGNNTKAGDWLVVLECLLEPTSGGEGLLLRLSWP